MKEKIAIFGGSFNPPCKHHQSIAEALSKHFDKVIIVPCGERKDKSTTNIIDSKHRGEMTVLTFSDLPNVTVDLFDLKSDKFTPTLYVHEHYQKIFPDADIWHVIGGDIVFGGKEGKSVIEQSWYRGEYIWKELKFAVIKRNGYSFAKKDLPPHSELIEIDELVGSSTSVRELIKTKESIDRYVDKKVKDYIEKNSLYYN